MGRFGKVQPIIIAKKNPRLNLRVGLWRGFLELEEVEMEI